MSLEQIASKIVKEMSTADKQNFNRIAFIAKVENTGLTGYSDLIDLSYFVENFISRD